MTTLIDLKNRLQKVDIPYEAETAVEATRSDMIARQKDQLLHGIRADGDKIGRYKNATYARKKNQLNPLAGYGFMDFKLTGQLYSEIFVDVREKTYVIFSADPKTLKLVERIGDPFDLTKDNKTEWVEESLRPQFMDQMHHATGL